MQFLELLIKREGVKGLRLIFEAGVQWIHLGRCVGDESGGGFPPGCDLWRSLILAPGLVAYLLKNTPTSKTFVCTCGEDGAIKTKI